MNTLFDNSIVRLCLAKFSGIFVRAYDAIRLLPIRAYRIFIHFRDRIQLLIKEPGELFNIPSHLYWWLELLFYIGDFLGLGEIYETLADIVKFNSRPLTSEELKLVQTFFPSSLNARRLRIDEYSFFGPRSHHFAYVSFYTINSWGPIQESIFVHELTHVWQYHQMGSVYIPRTLRAQFSQDGYDYGGLSNLVRAVETGKGLADFNLEQQGDIIADYHRLLNGSHARWGLGDKDDIWVYEKLMSDLRKSEERDLAA